MAGNTFASIRQTTGQESAGPIAEIKSFLVRQLPGLLPYMVAIWLLGIALFSLRLAGGFGTLRRYRASGFEPGDPELSERFADLCDRIGTGRRVRLFCSDSLRTPIAVGILKPIIIVPAGLLLQMDPRQLESIIVHELIHIRRHDPLISLMQAVAETLFFYHPCLWWISNQVRREREFAADAAVIDILNGNGLVYATALANLEEIRLTADLTAPPLAAAANGGNLVQRIQRILNGKTEISRASSAWSAALAIVLISAFLLTVLSFKPQSIVNAQTRVKDRRLAVGFVSIPPLDRTENAPKDADATARLIISKLQQYKIPAIGFVQGNMISDGRKLFPVRANIVRLWRDAGLEVGIGNFKHVWFYKTPYDEYVGGVEKNEAIVRELLAEKGLPLRYFSYPFLNTGKSVEERDRFERWLNDRGLQSIKYTFDNQEWMYSYAYDKARLDNDLNTMNEVRVSFIRYMAEMFDHYERYSRALFGRDIPQTMVLTPSRLVADSADDLFGMIRKRGYEFVPVGEAQSDEAYKTSENFIGESGISWFDRWTISSGRTLLDEPKVEASILKTWDENKRSAK